MPPPPFALLDSDTLVQEPYDGVETVILPPEGEDGIVAITSRSRLLSHT